MAVFGEEFAVVCTGGLEQTIDRESRYLQSGVNVSKVLPYSSTTLLYSVAGC